ncbi:hypothetical protein I4U23_002280 [Adineta vaga]|nr:hypothetical protein I4U23_002280 [Adineta vaga]
MSVSSEKPLVNREYSLRMPKNFQRPSNLLQRIYEQQIALEDMFTRGITVYGTVRVNNISFHKHVSIRFTIDQWKTSSTIDAHHMVYYSDTNTDLFQFKLTLQKEKLQSLSIVARCMSFAVCYDVNRREFWDNNYSRNYNLDVIESRARDEQIKSILYDDWFHRQIVQDYHAISKVSKQTQELCGLKNLGGTCYMNSVLQSLSLTSLLTDFLLTEKEFSIEIRSYSEGTILNEYLNLLLLLSCGDYCVLTPNPFKQIFGHLNNAYFKNQQQDAHEFLLLLLDCLDKDITKIKSDNENQNINQTENNLTFLDLFYGSYKTTTTCLQCQQSSSRLEPFICLSLPISSTNQCTLQDCLAAVSQCEYLTDDSKWFCPVCKYLCDAERRLEIEKFPKILIIQFKR